MVDCKIGLFSWWTVLYSRFNPPRRRHPARARSSQAIHVSTCASVLRNASSLPHSLHSRPSVRPAPHPTSNSNPYLTFQKSSHRINANAHMPHDAPPQSVACRATAGAAPPLHRALYLSLPHSQLPPLSCPFASSPRDPGLAAARSRSTVPGAVPITTVQLRRGRDAEAEQNTYTYAISNRVCECAHAHAAVDRRPRPQTPGADRRGSITFHIATCKQARQESVRPAVRPSSGPRAISVVVVVIIRRSE